MLYLEITDRASGKTRRVDFTDEKTLWQYCEEKGLLKNLNLTLRKVWEF